MEAGHGGSYLWPQLSNRPKIEGPQSEAGLGGKHKNPT
jgi:hypothetical protein